LRIGTIFVVQTSKAIYLHIKYYSAVRRGWSENVDVGSCHFCKQTQMKACVFLHNMYLVSSGHCVYKINSKYIRYNDKNKQANPPLL